jgi:hypothetical protein
MLILDLRRACWIVPLVKAMSRSSVAGRVIRLHCLNPLYAVADIEDMHRWRSFGDLMVIAVGER